MLETLIDEPDEVINVDGVVLLLLGQTIDPLARVVEVLCSLAGADHSTEPALDGLRDVLVHGHGGPPSKVERVIRIRYVLLPRLGNVLVEELALALLAAVLPIGDLLAVNATAADHLGVHALLLTPALQARVVRLELGIEELTDRAV
jgi:hypothetical protein